MNARVRAVRVAVAGSAVGVIVLAVILLSGAANPVCAIETPPGAWALRLTAPDSTVIVRLHPDGYYAIVTDAAAPPDWTPFPHVRLTDNILCIVTPKPDRIALYINREWAWSAPLNAPITRADAAFDSVQPLDGFPVEMNAG